MPKPMPSPPGSDIAGVDRDRVSRRDPAVVSDAAQDELDARQKDSPGRPITNVGAAFGRASSSCKPQD